MLYYVIVDKYFLFPILFQNVLHLQAVNSALSTGYIFFPVYS